MPLGQRRQRRQERRYVQVAQVYRAELLDDHVQVGQQRGVILRIGLGARETQQTVRQRGGILFGDGEDHLPEHAAPGC